MASRSRYVFVTPSEFAGWLLQTSQHLDLKVALDRFAGLPRELWDGRAETLYGVRRAYVMKGSADFLATGAEEVKPGKFGWLVLDVPRIDGATLLVIQIAAKSAWFDATLRRVLDAPEALQLFNRFWRQWKKHFTFPVCARNRKTGAEARYRGIGYSAGAAAWCQEGGELRQEGVDNVEFMIPSSNL